MIHPSICQHIVHFGMVGWCGNRLIERGFEIRRNSTHCIQFSMVFNKRKRMPGKTHIRHPVPSIRIGIVAHELIGCVRPVFTAHTPSNINEISNIIDSRQTNCIPTGHRAALTPGFINGVEYLYNSFGTNFGCVKRMVISDCVDLISNRCASKIHLSQTHARLSLVPTGIRNIIDFETISWCFITSLGWVKINDATHQ